jgi:hypothetical protein
MIESEGPNELPGEVTVPPITVPPPQAVAYPRAQVQPTSATDDVLKYVIPVNPSIWAIAAGYMGFFSILLIPAPIAIILGVLALKDLKKNPQKSGHVRAWFGIGAGSVMTLLSLILIVATLIDRK